MPNSESHRVAVSRRNARLVAASLVAVNVILARGTFGEESAAAEDQSRVRPAPALATMQVAGVGQLEGTNVGDRFQGRFVVFSVDGADESIFGKDASLFDANCVAAHGPGVQCANLIGILNGSLLEAFATSAPGFDGHLAVRTSAEEQFRIVFHAAPDGTANFDDLAALEAGQVVAVYKVREYITLDLKTQVFLSRSAFEIQESTRFTFNGVTTDFKRIAPRLTMVANGRMPEPRAPASPLPIPIDEPAFGGKGPGFFVARYPVSGFFMAVGK